MSNEAAERLREHAGRYATDPATLNTAIDAALADERKATVERIRAALAAHVGFIPFAPALDAILDAEAAR